AFALFYAPLHFLTVRLVLEAFGWPGSAPGAIVDLGCGTGASGAAWALAAGPHTRLTGFDLNSWVVREAAWTYHALGVRGTARQRPLARIRWRPEAAVLAAFTVNELSGPDRGALLPRLIDARQTRNQVLIVEPIARRMAPWWPVWQDAFAAAGGRADEWRVPVRLPPLLQQLDRAAGLDHRELTARSLWLSPRVGVEP
ncbi:MAG TPA: hypothetical protein VF136_02260, partial [Methylomirabilota bacterium]